MVGNTTKYCKKKKGGITQKSSQGERNKSQIEVEESAQIKNSGQVPKVVEEQAKEAYVKANRQGNKAYALENKGWQGVRWENTRNNRFKGSWRKIINSSTCIKKQQASEAIEKTLEKSVQIKR